MAARDENWYLRQDPSRKNVLDCIPLEGAAGYFELREKTGLTGEALDDSLKVLEGLGLIEARKTATEVFYWKIAEQPRKVWYTIEEAAGHMIVSKRTVQQLIRDVQLAAYRVGRGGHRRVKAVDLDSAMQLDDRVERVSITASEDPVLADLWENDQDSVYDRL